MKRFGLLLLACMASAIAAQDRAAAVVYNSNVITNNAWKRDVVMRHEPSGQIFNDHRQVGSAADLAAATATAEEAAAIADAANAAMTNEVRRLDAAAAGASTNALALALVLTIGWLPVFLISVLMLLIWIGVSVRLIRRRNASD